MHHVLHNSRVCAEDAARAKAVANQTKAANLKARGAAGGAKEPKVTGLTFCLGRGVSLVLDTSPN
jgi:hypothetical protein